MKNYLGIFLIAFFTTISFSCEDDSQSTVCDVKDPAEDLPWLKNMIDLWEVNSTIYTYMYVDQGTYLGQTVLIVKNCCPVCDSYFPVYNCAGQELQGVNLSDIKNLKTVWKPEDSLCTF